MYAKHWWNWIFGAVLVGLAYFVIVLNYPHTDHVYPATECKRTLHELQIAVERYQVDHGVYPTTIQRALDAGYISVPLRNPYLRGNDALVVETGVAQPNPGDYTYLPHFAGTPGASPIDGYVLLVYGDEHWRRQHATAIAQQTLPGHAERAVSWDSVVMVLEGGPWGDTAQSVQTE